MSPSPREYLQHIRDETVYLLQVTRDIKYIEFFHNETLKRACVRSLEIIGEAVKKLPADFKTSHPIIEWRAIAGMRDRLIHDYFGVDYELIWDVLINKIPSLHKFVIWCIEEQKI